MNDIERDALTRAWRFGLGTFVPRAATSRRPRIANRLLTALSRLVSDVR